MKKQACTTDDPCSSVVIGRWSVSARIRRAQCEPNASCISWVDSAFSSNSLRPSLPHRASMSTNAILYRMAVAKDAPRRHRCASRSNSLANFAPRVVQPSQQGMLCRSPWWENSEKKPYENVSLVNSNSISASVNPEIQQNPCVLKNLEESSSSYSMGAGRPQGSSRLLGAGRGSGSRLNRLRPSSPCVSHR
jgi:hypothetical protein